MGRFLYLPDRPLNPAEMLGRGRRFHGRFSVPPDGMTLTPPLGGLDEQVTWRRCSTARKGRPEPMPRAMTGYGRAERHDRARRARDPRVARGRRAAHQAGH